MKHFYLFIFMLFLFNKGIGQVEHLKLELKVENTRLSYIEPLFYQLRMTYDGEDTIAILSNSWQSYLPELQYYSEKKGQWLTLVDSDISMYKRYRPSGRNTYRYTEENIYNGYMIMKEVIYMPMNGDFYATGYLFKNKSQIRIRSVYYPIKSTDPSDSPFGDRTIAIYSNEVILNITEYEGEDRMVLAYLKELNTPHTVFEIIMLENWWGYYRAWNNKRAPKAIDEASLKYLISQYPNSKFTPWAYLTLARIKMSISGQDMKFEEAIKSETYKKRLLEAENYIKECLRYEDKNIKKYTKQTYYSFLRKKNNAGFYKHWFEYQTEQERIGKLFE